MFPKILQKCIKENIVCEKCAVLLQTGDNGVSSLHDISKLEVGFTEIGLQIWCPLHDVNVCHIDFSGNKLKADFRCLEPKNAH